MGWCENMTYQLKPVTQENEQMFFDLMRENMAECGADYENFHEGCEQVACLGGGVLFYQDDDLVGAAVLHDRTDGKTYLSDVFIRSDYRNEGHGRNLVKSCEKLAEHFGQRRMDLICEPDRLPFYEAMGYEETDIKDNGHYLQNLQKTLAL